MARAICCRRNQQLPSRAWTGRTRLSAKKKEKSKRPTILGSASESRALDESAAEGLSDAEKEELEALKGEIREKKARLQKDGLKSHEVNQHIEVVTMVHRMKKLKDREARAAAVLAQASATVQVEKWPLKQEYDTKKESRTAWFHRKHNRRQGILDEHFMNQVGGGKEIDKRKEAHKGHIKKVRKAAKRREKLRDGVDDTPQSELTEQLFPDGDYEGGSSTTADVGAKVKAKAKQPSSADAGGSKEEPFRSFSEEVVRHFKET